MYTMLMNVWLVLFFSILFVLYVAVRVTKPTLMPLSHFEIERRARENDARAVVLRERLRVAPLARALRQLAGAILVSLTAADLSGLIGRPGTVLAIIIVVIGVAWLERWPVLVSFGHRLYERIEPALHAMYRKRKYFFFLPIGHAVPDVKLGSEAELLHALDGASFLEPERRALIHSALEFTGLSVSDAMSNRRSIRSVDKGEVLGPLVLDELYKTGKQSFVVTDGDLDTVVGILKLERLTNLDLVDSPTAVNAMSPEVHYVDVDAPITDALSYLRSSKAPFLVVQDAGLKTVGLLTMDNILRCLFES